MDTIISFKYVRERVLDWWAVYGRHDLPWKKASDQFDLKPSHEQTTCELDPYRIWIAEIMLQQTQVGVMLPFWKRWMDAFPNVSLLAEAPLEEVLLIWQGLGYYRRAHSIHRASMNLKGDAWPRTLQGWMLLPGIGRTTAGSILSSAFNLPFPILDGNVRRLLTRLTGCKEPPSKSVDSRLWRLSFLLLDKERPRDFNQALMDLGALVCTSRNPKCSLCPLVERCFAYSIGQQSSFPVKMESRRLSIQVIGVGVIFNQRGEVLIDQRKNDGLLGGMWEFPGGKQEQGEPIKSTVSREIIEELAITVEVGEELISFAHAYSHKRLRFVVHICEYVSGEPKPLASQQVRWVEPKSLNKYPFPAANTKIIDALMNYIKSI
ncbi:8-oxo-dGTP diphosphatase MutT [Prochlorococcus sp. MIT 1341]|uniref:8-oxo-dGTP diphosphatase MutT n=1 Tax=Prochlorococcus sp. MIT 1341 TaxID=3096221 RepID=UPI002A752176|nr:8-oxo-dGTP diphosphatase MutT [Prochlorococcus sp. MIT 1341]